MSTNETMKDALERIAGRGPAGKRPDGTDAAPSENLNRVTASSHTIHNDKIDTPPPAPEDQPLVDALRDIAAIDPSKPGALDRQRERAQQGLDAHDALVNGRGMTP